MTNEIIWKRTNTKSHAFNRFSSAHDVILMYRKGEEFIWNAQYEPHSDKYIKSHYSNIEEETGRRYTLGDCTNPNPNRPNLTYEWNGITKVWRWTKEKMQKMHDEGRLHYTKSGAPRFKRYLDEMKGTPISSVWTDIPPINSQAQERLGYPTQKPVALLERILNASSNPGDVVLDPFCGCGTTVHAAQKLDRQWIGIDVTHLAIGLIEKRLREAFETVEFQTHGVPQDYGGARALAEADKFEFEKWALSTIDAQPGNQSKKGADRGIDGNIYFDKTKRAIVSVKGGRNLGVAMIRDLVGTLDREKAEIGVFLCLEEPTRPMVTEAAAAGQCEIDGFAPVPRVQIVTIEQALELRDRAVKLPLRRSDTFKKAARETDPGAQGALDL